MFVCTITYHVPETTRTTSVVERSNWSNDDAYKVAYGVAFRRHGITTENILRIEYS
jgi:hypothetical protein